MMLMNLLKLMKMYYKPERRDKEKSQVCSEADMRQDRAHRISVKIMKNKAHVPYFNDCLEFG
jgi:hypothetical protein